MHLIASSPVFASVSVKLVPDPVITPYALTVAREASASGTTTTATARGTKTRRQRLNSNLLGRWQILPPRRQKDKGRTAE